MKRLLMQLLSAPTTQPPSWEQCLLLAACVARGAVYCLLSILPVWPTCCHGLAAMWLRSCISLPGD
jgi:hypothetical protein